MAQYFEIMAVEKHIRMSPRKVRLIADLVRGRGVDEAIALLERTPRLAANEVKKAIMSAAANATNGHDLDRENLFVSSIRADEGPTLKRMKAGARGRFKPILKRSAHITVGVAERTAKSGEEK